MNAHGTQLLPSDSACRLSAMRSQPPLPGVPVFTHTGICHCSAERACASAGSRTNRCCVMSTDERPLMHDNETSSSGAPGWLMNVGMIRSTGLPETADIAVQKSCELALPYAWDWR